MTLVGSCFIDDDDDDENKNFGKTKGVTTFLIGMLYNGAGGTGTVLLFTDGCNVRSMSVLDPKPSIFSTKFHSNPANHFSSSFLDCTPFVLAIVDVRHSKVIPLIKPICSNYQAREKLHRYTLEQVHF